ncbi:clostripain-related cysteine peptidase [Ruminococcus albus]|uniref:Peptidase C11 clostripain n=1 Tax=Ruminococcus albus (strain ATCC 27210 / DSM 20455 / JCM 14654 / NCDO 2250 / 7) TaxID=697329 RepID=E6UIL5_RUMA7|nr:clostripain-related cysteine peptidase [Ruminococcus albus]ADU23360.1 peptidase C11 clostripain [Ruminococcus albus 7 = DSM 20455]
MDNNNRPRARQKNYQSGGSGVHKRGSGIGGGPVGSGSGGGSSSGGGVNRAALGGGGSLLIVIAIVVFNLLTGGKGGSTSGGVGGNGSSPSGFEAVDTSGFTAYNGTELDTTVAAGSREKYTSIKGDGKDTVTLMVYICGTDLESKYGMASSDLAEMAASKYGDNVNIVVYTGGCKAWKTKGVSENVNQIYQVKDGGLKPLVKDDGKKPMTDPSNLSSFIKYCSKNFPANRNELILWDHGGGSVSGYGYDEKNKSAGSMDLAGINKALKDGGVKFDFIGFDACLMATAETALMLGQHADYMIASEETEPGIGWYYTNWLTKLGENTSMPTIEIGKNIVDDFVAACGKKCPSSQTTLSVIDLAEFANTVPSKLSAFATSVSGKITAKDYKSVSTARNNTREFAKSSKIDQVDLVDLADKVGTSEGKALCDALKGAVKYNRTSASMTNAYGVSIYFPYQRTSFVDSACSTYSAIGMGDEYSKCIRQFAKLETSGQIAAGGTGSPIGSLFGSGSSGSSGSADIISGLLGAFLGGSGKSIDGLDRNNTDFMNEDSISDSDTAEYLSLNYFDVNNLVWDEKDGKHLMELPENQWKLVQSIDLNLFYDDGNGYIDLGLDNMYSFEDGKLAADTDKTWLSINGQPVAYYHTDTVENGDDYTITGYVPALLNGDRVDLILKFTDEKPEGEVIGATDAYVDGETDTVAKGEIDIKDGDTIDFLCDYYSYDGDYQDSYMLGEQITVNGALKLSDTDVGDGSVRLTYKFTDIYDQAYWTPYITLK